MSTTEHTLDEVQGRDDPTNIFERYVFTDASTCSSCFQRIRAGAATTVWGSDGHDKEDKGTRAAPKRMHETAPGEIGPEGITIGTRQVPNPERAVYPEYTVCEDCGSVGGLAFDDPLTQRQAVERCETLAERLRELGEPVDVAHLKRAVGHLKSLEEYASDDTRIYKAATAVAVRRSR